MRQIKDRSDDHLQYQIEPALRSHVDPLSRSVLIDVLGTAVRSLSSPPLPTSPLSNRPLFEVSANLTGPDLVILPTVLRNCYCLSIVQGKLWSGKFGRKFNVDAIAEDVRKLRIAMEGPTKPRGVDEDGAASSERMDVDAAEETATPQVAPVAMDSAPV